jgi:predicted dehydrogenase/threonine dehydrogenase-like Zn-dependent dehydrogenase
VKQVVQPLAGGNVKVIDVPRPVITATEVLVQTVASIISPGTERSVTSLAQSGLVAKARARPDLVRQVINKAKHEGVASTLKSVRGRLDEDLPLGYSAVGVAREVGTAVAGITPGQIVATAGAGKANHAEFQAVPGLLCSVVPEGVSTDDAAFATIASVALHGFRLADVGPGARVVVLGLGLVGQLAVRIARAAGCQVAGIDVTAFPVEIASLAGASAFKEAGDRTTEAIMSWSREMGADAVLVTAGGRSSDAIMRVPSICRDRASVVVVGDVGLDLQRTPFYEKELTLRFARSYGPGRYEHTYEEWGVDYPSGYVRWTEGRNLEAVLDLMAAGHLEASDLVTHRFPIDSAGEAYQVVLHPAEPVLGIMLEYPEEPTEREPLAIRPRKRGKGMGIGLIGAGSFARSVLVPGLQDAGFARFVSVTSATGISARKLADRVGFEKVVSGADAVISDPDVEVVIIATPHDSHADLTASALRAGKHVFCEKPLALTYDELNEVEKAWHDGEGVLFVGFNRRWSAPLRMLKNHFPTSQPVVMSYRVNAGAIPAGHWYRDRRQGGRLLGEVCHFVDTCAALVGEPAIEVSSFSVGTNELLLRDNLILSLRYGDGSLASIVYSADGHPNMEKERLEVLAGGRSATVVDFRQVILNGRSSKGRRQDKGHGPQMRAFLDAVRTGSSDTNWAIASTRTTLDAAATLTGTVSRNTRDH